MRPEVGVSPGAGGELDPTVITHRSSCGILTIATSTV